MCPNWNRPLMLQVKIQGSELFFKNLIFEQIIGSLQILTHGKITATPSLLTLALNLEHLNHQPPHDIPLSSASKISDQLSSLALSTYLDGLGLATLKYFEFIEFPTSGTAVLSASSLLMLA